MANPVSMYAAEVEMSIAAEVCRNERTMGPFPAVGYDGILVRMGDFTTRTTSQVNPFGTQKKYQASRGVCE